MPSTVYFCRAFIGCKEVAAVINVGCCYNLLSDEASNDERKELYGFPMSDTVGKLGLQVGRSARDLACQVRSHYTSLYTAFKSCRASCRSQCIYSNLTLGLIPHRVQTGGESTIQPELFRISSTMPLGQHFSW
jgi:hypothetical protein